MPQNEKAAPPSGDTALQIALYFEFPLTNSAAFPLLRRYRFGMAHVSSGSTEPLSRASSLNPLLAGSLGLPNDVPDRVFHFLATGYW